MNESTPDIRALAGSLEKQAEVLLESAGMEQTYEPVETDEIVRRMLERASHLVRAASALGVQRNPTALAVLARAVLENLILMLWVQVSPENAESFNQMADAEFLRAARINLEKGKARIINRQSGEDSTAEMLESDRFKNLARRVSIESRAREAGVEDLYTVFYRFLSLDIHGHTLPHDERSPDDATTAHLHGIGALAIGSGHAGVRWLIHRQRTDNETLRQLLGLNDLSPNGQG